MVRPATPLRRAYPAGALGAVALAILAVVYFTALVGIRPLSSPDEARYAEIAREMLAARDFVTPRLDGAPFLDKPPLLYWAEAAALAAFGVTPGAARLVPALAGAFGVFVAFAAARSLFGPRPALLGALVLATTPLYYAAGQFVNADLLVAVLIAATMLAFLVGLEDGRSRWFFAAYACAALATLAKGLIGAVLPALVLGLTLLVAGRLRDLARSRLPAGLALYAAIVAPWFAIAQRANPDLFEYLVIGQHFGRYTAQSGFNNPQPWWFYPAVVAGGLGPWLPVVADALVRRAGAARRAAREHPAELAMIIWAAAVTAFFSVPATKIVGYILPVFPPLALLAGLHLHRMLEEPSRTPATPLVLAAAGTLAGGIAAGAALAWLPPPVHAGDGYYPAAAAFAGLLVAAAISALALARRSRGVAIAALAAGAAVVCIGAAVLGRHFIDGSAAELAQRFRSDLRAGDEVVHFRGYFYAVPFVLDRPRPDVVADPWAPGEALARDNWRRELYLGRQRRPEAAGWLVTLDELDRLLQGPRKVFVFVDEKDLPDLLKRAPATVLGRSGRIVLVANGAAARRERP